MTSARAILGPTRGATGAEAMTEPLQKRTDYSNPWVIAAGLIALSLVVFRVPIFIDALHVAGGVLVLLYLFSRGKSHKAKQLARRRMGGRQPALFVELSPGLHDAVVMNDWGVVCVQ